MYSLKKLLSRKCKCHQHIYIHSNKKLKHRDKNKDETILQQTYNMQYI